MKETLGRTRAKGNVPVLTGSLLKAEPGLGTALLAADGNGRVILALEKTEKSKASLHPAKNC